MDGFPVVRYAAQLRGEQQTNLEKEMNIDEGQRMDREDGSQWDEFELSCNLLLIFSPDDAT